MKIDLQEIIVMVVLIFAALSVALICSGCHILQPTVEAPVTLTPVQQVQEIVRGTNWLATLSIIGVGAGFFSFLNGGTRGVQIMATCLVVLSLVIGIARYSAWIAAAAVAGAVGLLAYTIYTKTKAVKEIVSGVQKFKNSYDPVDEDPIKSIKYELNKQSSSTQKLVSNVKNNLNN